MFFLNMGGTTTSRDDVSLRHATRPRVDGRAVTLLAVLPLLVVLVFGAALGNEFILFDDDRYITDNYHVRSGLTMENLRWALTATTATNWHPLTWWSHMLDAQMYGVKPWGHHLTSLALHAANALLLCLLFHSMTGNLWMSFLIAVLFAVHPLHVESVAWAAERKDVLSGLFFMLSFLAYVWYLRKPGFPRKFGLTLLFSLGLMAKPMLVTLPFLLLLVDFWPLGRFGRIAAGARLKGDVSGETSPLGRFRGALPSLLSEKIPLFILSALSSIVTFLVQEHGGAVGPLQTLPLLLRVGNAVLAYGRYLFKTIWPVSLGVFYTHPMFDLPRGPTMVSLILLTLVTLPVLLSTSRRPYLVVGWLWFLGSLLPVIGLVQVGAQAMADRYTYLPLIGLSVIPVWGSRDIVRRLPQLRVPAVIATACLVTVLSILARIQVGYWKDTFTLFEHTAQVTKDNYFALLNLGIAYGKAGQYDRAETVYRETLRLVPEWEEAHFQLGLLLVTKGDLSGAAQEYRVLRRLDPDMAERLQKFILFAGSGS